jgi:hydrogenase nickel incorporation protein HypB
MFQISSVLIVNKIDLLPYVDCDMEKIRTYAHQLNPNQSIMEVSCRTGEGLERWLSWLEARVAERRGSRLRS